VQLIWRICSPNPGMTLSAIASVASGVTSRARPGAAGGEDEMTSFLIAQLFQSRFDHRLFVGYQPVRPRSRA